MPRCLINDANETNSFDLDKDNLKSFFFKDF
jgi:hypothetical protein